MAIDLLRDVFLEYVFFRISPSLLLLCFSAVFFPLPVFFFLLILVAVFLLFLCMLFFCFLVSLLVCFPVFLACLLRFLLALFTLCFFCLCFSMCWRSCERCGLLYAHCILTVWLWNFLFLVGSGRYSIFLLLAAFLCFICSSWFAVQVSCVSLLSCASCFALLVFSYFCV